MKDGGMKRYIAELVREGDRYELIADRLLGPRNKPSNWLDLWIGCRTRAWDSRMRAQVMAQHNRLSFNLLVRRHVKTTGGHDAS
jgi:hypothetical protein